MSRNAKSAALGRTSRAGAPSERARQRRLAARTRARTARILVCEHAADGNSPVREAVRSVGYEVAECATLADALREGAKAPVDLVITVVGPRDDENLRLLHLFRRAHPRTPIVIVSSDGSIEMRSRCQRVQPIYFAVLPLAEEELRSIVSAGLSRPAGRDA